MFSLTQAHSDHDPCDRGIQTVVRVEISSCRGMLPKQIIHSRIPKYRDRLDPLIPGGPLSLGDPYPWGTNSLCQYSGPENKDGPA